MSMKFTEQIQKMHRDLGLGGIGVRDITRARSGALGSQIKVICPVISGQIALLVESVTRP
jgi:hypothetical protein